MESEIVDSRVRGFRELRVWHLGIELADRVFLAIQEFPKHELYGLTSQLNRASSSVSMNIAEGSGRTTSGEFIQSLGHARGSLYEVYTLVEISLRRGYIDKEIAGGLQETCDDIGRMLTGLMKKLAENKSKGNSRATH